jgi:hypothetical protein
MCLENAPVSLTKGIGIGYKVYIKTEDGLARASSSLMPALETNLLSGKWLKSKADELRLRTENRTCEYDGGFHIFTSLDDALDWWSKSFDSAHKRIFLEVEYKGVLAVGQQENQDKNPLVVVAKYMRVVKQIFPEGVTTPTITIGE